MRTVGLIVGNSGHVTRVTCGHAAGRVCANLAAKHGCGVARRADGVARSFIVQLQDLGPRSSAGKSAGGQRCSYARWAAGHYRTVGSDSVLLPTGHSCTIKDSNAATVPVGVRRNPAARRRELVSGCGKRTRWHECSGVRYARAYGAARCPRAARRRRWAGSAPLPQAARAVRGPRRVAALLHC